MARKGKKTAPEWSKAYFSLAIDRHRQLTTALDASAKGIAVQQDIPDLLRALEKSGEKLKVGELERAKKMAEFSKAETEAKFPTLAGFGTLAMWSWLEAFVIDYCVLWVRKRPSALKKMEGPKIKVDLSE